MDKHLVVAVIGMAILAVGNAYFAPTRPDRRVRIMLIFSSVCYLFALSVLLVAHAA